jgi:hypothetical protein
MLLLRKGSEVNEVRKTCNRAWDLAAAAVLAAGLSACASAPPPDAVYVETAPPAMRAETSVVSPGPGYVWVPGWWNWSGGDYVWVTGVWLQPPRPATRWVAPVWRQTSRGWYRVDGHWR